MTQQFAVKEPLFVHEYGPWSTVGLYLESFWEPFGTLWFIYLLPIFFMVTKLAHNAAIPQVVVLAAGAALQIATIHTGHTVVDEFAGRFVFFYTGYMFAPRIFALAETAQALPATTFAPVWDQSSKLPPRSETGSPHARDVSEIGARCSLWIPVKSQIAFRPNPADEPCKASRMRNTLEITPTGAASALDLAVLVTAALATASPSRPIWKACSRRLHVRWRTSPRPYPHHDPSGRGESPAAWEMQHDRPVHTPAGPP